MIHLVHRTKRAVTLFKDLESSEILENVDRENFHRSKGAGAYAVFGISPVFLAVTVEVDLVTVKNYASNGLLREISASRENET